jgi:hypothetical protein
MEVKLSLKDWKVVQDSETKLPKVAGKYVVLMGEKEIATQAFNDGYGSKEIPFTGDAMRAIMAAEKEIKAELEKLLS